MIQIITYLYLWMSFSYKLEFVCGDYHCGGVLEDSIRSDEGGKSIRTEEGEKPIRSDEGENSVKSDELDHLNKTTKNKNCQNGTIFLIKLYNYFEPAQALFLIELNCI